MWDPSTMRGLAPIAPWALTVLAFVGGCAATNAPAARGSTTGTVTPADRVVADASLAALVAASGFGGSIALADSDDATVRCSDVVDCTARSSPASTFKIVSSIVALESGVAPDPGLQIPWDGQTRSFANWNHDMDMREAFAVSCLPYYQELVRRIGRERFAAPFARLDYGNGAMGPTLDAFWLDGSLVISPVEQVAFLRRLEEGRLPITSRTRELVREVMIRERRGDAVLRGKTGWAMAGTADERGWFVGYVTHDDREVTYVAVRLIRSAATADDAFLAARPRLAIAALEQAGAYPAAP